jgi:hypothetical protein
MACLLDINECADELIKNGFAREDFDWSNDGGSEGAQGSSGKGATFSRTFDIEQNALIILRIEYETSGDSLLKYLFLGVIFSINDTRPNITREYGRDVFLAYNLPITETEELVEAVRVFGGSNLDWI